MGRIFSFLFGAALGGFVGGVIGLLLAPKSGQALRGDVTGYADSLKNEIARAAQQRRMELTSELNRLREPEIPM